MMKPDRSEGGMFAIFLALLACHRVVGDRFCGVDQNDARDSCWQPCNTDSDCCSVAQQCFDVGSSCGSSDLSGTAHNFCGKTWCDAAYLCGTPCPGGTDGECYPGEHCFANTPCDGSNWPQILPPPPSSSLFQYCGSSMADASGDCWQPCPRGDSDCCFGLKCFDTSSGKSSGRCSANSDLDGANRYFCGSSWCDAAYSCGVACPGGTNAECPPNEFCYADVPCDGSNEPPTKFCGVDQDDARGSCWQPCNTDSDCCSFAQKCFEVGSSCGSSDLSGTAHNFCGKTWCDAAYLCGTPCPGGTDGECNPGEYCFANTPCDGSNWPPILPPPPSSSPYQYCGSSMADASGDCWQPCPRGDSDCCFGLKCFDTSAGESSGTCSANSDLDGANHYFCGSSWCDAAYSCGVACPRGTNAECPPNEFCYADVPCDGSNEPPSDVSLSVPSDIMSLSAPLDVVSSSMSKYCGTSPAHAAELCWQPCRDDDDCCADQTCHSDVTSCGYPNAIGTDHFFCGSDFCDASYECRAPCPSGFDVECDPGYRCFPNTPCNANMRSYGAGMDSSETLDYGLPTSAVALFRQYRSESANGQTDGQTNGQTTNASSECDDPWGCFEFWHNSVNAQTYVQTTNATSANARSTGGVLGLIFGITILCLIVGNFLLARRQRRYDAGPTTATIQTPTTANRPPSQRHRR